MCVCVCIHTHTPGQVSWKEQNWMLVMGNCSSGQKGIRLQVKASMRNRRAMVFRLRKASVFINYKVRI